MPARPPFTLIGRARRAIGNSWMHNRPCWPRAGALHAADPPRTMEREAQLALATSPRFGPPPATSPPTSPLPGRPAPELAPLKAVGQRAGAPVRTARGPARPAVGHQPGVPPLSQLADRPPNLVLNRPGAKARWSMRCWVGTVHDALPTAGRANACWSGVWSSTPASNLPGLVEPTRPVAVAFDH